VVPDHIPVLMTSNYIHLLFMHAYVYNMMDPKLRICLVSFELPGLNLGCYIYVVATLVAYT
jgi:hypothetical protein